MFPPYEEWGGHSPGGSGVFKRRPVTVLHQGVDETVVGPLTCIDAGRGGTGCDAGEPVTEVGLHQLHPDHICELDLRDK